MHHFDTPVAPVLLHFPAVFPPVNSPREQAPVRLDWTRKTTTKKTVAAAIALVLSSLVSACMVESGKRSNPPEEVTEQVTYGNPKQKLVPTTKPPKGEEPAKELLDLVDVKAEADMKKRVIFARVDVRSNSGWETVQLAGKIDAKGDATLQDRNPLRQGWHRLIGEAHCVDKAECKKIILNLYYKVGRKKLKKQFVTEAMTEKKREKETPDRDQAPVEDIFDHGPHEGGGSENELDGEDQAGEYVGPTANEKALEKLWERPEDGSQPNDAKGEDEEDERDGSRDSGLIIEPPPPPQEREETTGGGEPGRIETNPPPATSKPAAPPATDKPAVNPPSAPANPPPKPAAPPVTSAPPSASTQPNKPAAPAPEKPAAPAPVPEKPAAPAPEKPVAPTTPAKPQAPVPAPDKPAAPKPNAPTTPPKEEKPSSPSSIYDDPDSTKPAEAKPETKPEPKPNAEAPSAPARPKPPRPRRPAPPPPKPEVDEDGIPVAPDRKEQEERETRIQVQLSKWLDLRNGGQAVGDYTDGSLDDGTNLPKQGPNWRQVYQQRDTLWGTGLMVSMIKNVSELIAKQFPGTVTYIGDIGRRYGGHFSANHNSHQNGLDADIPYLGNVKFTSVLENGRLVRDFEYSKNWQFFRWVASQQILLDRKRVTVLNRIFVNPSIKVGLCAWANRHGLLNNPLDADIMRRIRPTPGHDKHFHVRLKCSPYYPACRNQVEPPSGTGCQ